MNNYFFPIMFIVAIFFSTIAMTNAPVGVQLIGIFNKLSKNSNTPSLNPATVRIKSTREAVTGLPWVPRSFLKLPVEVELTFAAKNLDENGNPQPYTIRIEEDAAHHANCPPDKTCVSAQIYARQIGDLSAWPQTKQSTCVSKSVFFIKTGDLISQWQNVMLFVADPEDPSSKVPFSFGLAAWTATTGLWHYDFIDYAPADLLTGAPKVLFEKQPITINNHRELQGLRVLQGQQAWGGGQVPRPYFLHISHIYNASSYPILARRTVRALSAYNFIKIIPPRSVMPFALVWLPKLTASQAMLPQEEPLHLFVLSKTSKEQLPQAFSSIDDVGDTEITTGLSEEEINSAISNIMQNMSTPAQQLAHYTTMIDELKRDPNDRYLVGNYLYKIYAITGNSNADPQTVCINRCTRTSVEEETVYQLQKPEFHGVHPKFYLRLIINDKKEIKDSPAPELITLDLATISEETVFEQ